MTDIGDPYRVLGLRPGASMDDVKRAYRRLAKRYHPDSTGGAATAPFLAVQAAYEALVSSASGPSRGVAGTNRRPTSRPAPGARPRPAGPGRTASGASGPAGATGSRGAPWEADPDRARATRAAHERYRTGRATGTPPPDARASGGRPAGGPVHRSVRKASLGSTSYDEAATESREPQWGGATWYGQASGTYWTINPKEYADPRKHGPEYQARGRRRTGGDAPEDAGVVSRRPGPGRSVPEGGDDAVDRPAAARPAPDGPSAGAAGDRSWSIAGSSATVAGTDAASRPAAGATDAGPAASWTWRGGSTAGPSTDEGWTAGGPMPAGSTAAGATGTRATGTRATAAGATDAGATDAGATDAGRPAGPTDAAPSPAATIEAPAADHLRLPARVTLALIAWPVIGLAVAGVIGAITGCDRFAASCPRPLDLGPLAVQPLIVALLLLVPPVAEVAAVGTVAVALAAIPATVLLSAMGSPRGRSGEASAVLFAILAVAYLIGVAAALAGRARIPEAFRGR